jgi:hypothetical protein
MDSGRFEVVVQPNADDNGASFIVVAEVIGFPDSAQAQAFRDQLSQWLTNADNHDGR